MFAILQSAQGGGFDWRMIFNPAVVWVFIPIGAIMVQGVLAILKQMNRHEERLAMIKQGMNPDTVTEERAEQQHA